MFWHSFKYNLKITLRDKTQIFWNLVFIIILGTLFKSTFGNAYDTEILNEIKVVSYIEDQTIKNNVSDFIENITVDEAGEKKLLNITYADSMDEAMELLEDSDQVGLFYSEDGMLKLKVKETGIAESVLSIVVSQYHQIVSVMTDVSDKTPDVQMAVMEILMSEGDENVQKVLSDGNMDPYIQYFYNLLAMACLLASSAGVTFCIKNQANLSDLGARKNLGGTNSFSRTFGGLLAIWLVLCATSLISFTYFKIIGVDFGNRIPAVILIILVGTLMGLSAGFFVGSIGKLSKGVKDAIATTYSILTCFLSGLMIMDMRMIIELKCPIINDINPAVWISDAFYSLVIYDTYDRYWHNIILMLCSTVAFIIAGTLLGRRKQYASL